MTTGVEVETDDAEVKSGIKRRSERSNGFSASAVTAKAVISASIIDDPELKQNDKDIIGLAVLNISLPLANIGTVCGLSVLKHLAD